MLFFQKKCNRDQKNRPFFQNFSQKNRKSSLIHQNDKLDELITIMDGSLVLRSFGHFWSICWSRSGGDLIGPVSGMDFGGDPSKGERGDRKSKILENGHFFGKQRLFFMIWRIFGEKLPKLAKFGKIEK